MLVQITRGVLTVIEWNISKLAIRMNTDIDKIVRLNQKDLLAILLWPKLVYYW